jgi:hypothetical protein
MIVMTPYDGNKSHTHRVSVVTAMIEAGMPPELVQDVGHASLVMTLDYNRADASVLDDLLTRLRGEGVQPVEPAEIARLRYDLRWLSAGDGRWNRSPQKRSPSRRKETLMNERKLEVTLPREFVKLCARDGCTPEDVINGFLADLCSLDTSNGSDERMLARRYYERVGYPWMNRS